jgi:hypothetical protein
MYFNIGAAWLARNTNVLVNIELIGTSSYFGIRGWGLDPKCDLACASPQNMIPQLEHNCHCRIHSTLYMLRYSENEETAIDPPIAQLAEQETVAVQQSIFWEHKKTKRHPHGEDTQDENIQ